MYNYLSKQGSKSSVSFDFELLTGKPFRILTFRLYYANLKNMVLKYLVLMTTRSRDWLLVPFWVSWCKNKKGQPGCNHSVQNYPRKDIPT